MSDPSTVFVHSIGGLEVTTNGEFLLIHGNQPTIAFHRAVFNDLLVALPNAIERSDRIVQNNDGVNFALHCQGWEIGRIDGTQSLVIRFLLAGTAALSFSVPCDQVPYMLQALGGAAGVASTGSEPVRTIQ